ncbi:hypothetical protein EBU99_13715, partial [bacterium]|nr:hypothetical protein [bacterium]
ATPKATPTPASSVPPRQTPALEGVKPKTPPAAAKKPTPPLDPEEPKAKLRNELRNSKETFDKTKSSEDNFINNLKKDEDFKFE